MAEYGGLFSLRLTFACSCMFCDLYIVLLGAGRLVFVMHLQGMGSNDSFSSESEK